MNSVEGIADLPSFVSEDCSFAPADRDSTSKNLICVVPVEIHNNTFAEKKIDHGLSVEVLQFAWAVLLQTYLFEDVITFAYLAASDTDTSEPNTKQGDPVSVVKASLYQYRSFAERQIEEFGPDSRRALTSHDVEDNHINMAMALFIHALPNLKQPNEEQRAGHLYQHDGALYEVSHYSESP